MMKYELSWIYIGLYHGPFSIVQTIGQLNLTGDFIGGLTVIINQPNIYIDLPFEISGYELSTG